MCLFVRKAEPKVPPTSSAAQDALSFRKGFAECWKNKSFVVLMICLGGGVGLFSAMYTLIQQVMCVKGYSNKFAGLCGALFIIGGLVGSAITGVIVDRTKMFQEVIKVCYLGAAVSACGIAMLTNHPSMEAGVAILCTAFGFFGFALYPVGLEAGVECTFPTAEGTSSGLIIIAGQVIGIVLVLIMDLGLATGLKGSPDWSIEVCSAGGATGVVPVRNMTWATLFWAAVTCAFAISITVAFNPVYKRLNHERKLGRETILAQKEEAAFPL